MSDQKVTELTEATTIIGVEKIYVVQGGVSKRMDVSLFRSLMDLLTQNLDADDHVINNFRFKGGVDLGYDLATDSDSIISGGIINLSEDTNIYYHANLTSAVEIAFPSPVSTGTAPFGMVTFALGSGGSVSLPDNNTWVWEKADAAASDPAIPTADGSVFRLRYSYDPVTEKYGLSLTFLSAPAAAPSGQVTLITSSITRHTQTSRSTTNSATHTFVSTAQDGTVYLIVGFMYDGPYGPDSVPAFLQPINNPPVGTHNTRPQGFWYYYKPSQGELDTGSLDLVFTTTGTGGTGEAGSFLTFEASGVDSDNPIGEVNFNRSSSESRTNIDSINLSPSIGNSLLVACCMVDQETIPLPTLSVLNTNSFTTRENYPSGVQGVPGFIFTTKDAEEPGTYPTPSFLRSTDGLARTALEAFVLNADNA